MDNLCLLGLWMGRVEYQSQAWRETLSLKVKIGGTTLSPKPGTNDVYMDYNWYTYLIYIRVLAGNSF